jgi:dTDP-4-amino-4,6-dideoxygalactose transaminase
VIGLSKHAIAKLATCRAPGRVFEQHPNARTALRHYLRECRLERGETILLPSYIGWSPREGSGIFDPIRELALDYAFYRLDDSLGIDLDSLRQMISRANPRLLLLVHYFGHVDPGYADAVSLARAAGLRIIEDEAHAMLSDLVGAACGRLGDVCLYSLHKLLPMNSGGMLVRNHIGEAPAPGADAGALWSHDLWSHDLAAIASARRRNARRLYESLGDLDHDIEPLWPSLSEGEVPQTLPVRLLRANRDGVYHDMNRAGYGVVSLYHTLIDAIGPSDFPASHRLARRILNLPVHQDILSEQLDAMTAYLKQSLRENRA